MSSTEIGVRQSVIGQSDIGNRKSAIGCRQSAIGDRSPAIGYRPSRHTPDGYEVLARISASIAIPAALAGAITFGLSFLAPGAGGAELALYGLGTLGIGVLGTGASIAFENRSTTKQR